MSAPASENPLPNIVYIMADDMGFGDVGCYGAEKIPTPNLDRLAAAGLRFTDAHSSSSVCTPSRYGVMTGRYCWRSRLKKWVLWGFEPPLIETERLTLASMLSRQGYATAAVGKWHLGLRWKTTDGAEPLANGYNVDYAAGVAGGPLDLGFDRCFIITGSLDMAPYCFIRDRHTVGIPAVEKDPYMPQQREGLMTPDWRDDEVDQRFAEEAVSFIEASAKDDPEKPFFLYLTPSAPHRPCVPPDFIAGRSQAGPRGDMVCMVDWMVGRVMEALERGGVAENTLVVVTSDNGARLTCYDGSDYGHKSCGDWRGQKADIWEGGHREPCIVRWPARVAPGRICDEAICLVDFFATVADIVGFELPDTAAEDSFSFLSALVGEASERPLREAVIHHSGDGMFSLRRGPWKLIVGLGSGGFTAPRREEPVPGGPEGQLYHLGDDPAETRNLWQERPDVVTELRAILERWQRDGRSRSPASDSGAARQSE